MGNSNSSSSQDSSSSTGLPNEQIYRTTSYCPIFGTDYHKAILFSEPAWHFTNPQYLPLFGFYITTSKSKQIASQFTNDDLIQYSNTITERYINDGMKRIDLPPLFNSPKNTTTKLIYEPRPTSLNKAPQFHLHVEEYDSNDIGIDTNDRQLLITLPFPSALPQQVIRQSNHTIMIPSASATISHIDDQHLYYFASKYQFPSPSVWDIHNYTYNNEDVRKTSLFSKTSTFQSTVQKDDTYFYKKFLPLQQSVTIRAIFPIDGFSCFTLQTLHYKRPEIYNGQNLRMFPFIIIFLDPTEQSSRDAFTSFITKVTELRLAGFIFNIIDVPLFIFLDQTHLDQTHQPIEFTTLDQFIINQSNTLSGAHFNFSSLSLSISEITTICTLIGFQPENIHIHQITINNPLLPSKDISLEYFYPTLFQSECPTDISPEEHTQNIATAKAAVQSTLTTIKSIIRPHIVNLKVLSKDEYDFISNNWYIPARNLKLQQPIPFFKAPLYPYNPLLPYMKLSQPITSASIYKLKLFSVFGQHYDGQQAIGNLARYRDGFLPKSYWDSKFYHTILAMNLNDRHTIITITNNDQYNEHIYGEPAIPYKDTFNIQSIPSETSLDTPLSIIPLTTSYYFSPYQLLYRACFLPFYHDERDTCNNRDKQVFPDDFVTKFRFGAIQTTGSLLLSHVPLHIIIIDQGSQFIENDGIPNQLPIKIIEQLKQMFFDKYLTIYTKEDAQLKFQQIMRFHFIKENEYDDLILQIRQHALRERLNLILESLKQMK